jgi:CheY-like chemotaxis protein
MVLNLGQMVLSSFGYRVLTAPSGEAALEIFQKSESPIDLLITDMVMPRMNGRELIEKVRVLSPTTRIVCSTAVVRVSQKKDDLDYLEKPFTTQQLLRKVKEALSPVEVT